MKTRPGRAGERRNREFRPGGEALEHRVVPSWTGTPPAKVNVKASGSDRIAISSFDRDGNYSHTNSITRNEVDYRTFTPQRSGTYTFEARATESKIDTVAALYDRNGRRLAFNNNAGPNTRDSKLSYRLDAGTTYVLAVTNYRNSPKGKYRVVITVPDLFDATSTSPSGSYSSGSASLQGTTLRFSLAASNSSLYMITDHYIEVHIYDRNGSPIHQGMWRRSIRTGGALVRYHPSGDVQTWNLDVSFLDLSRANHLRVDVYND